MLKEREQKNATFLSKVISVLEQLQETGLLLVGYTLKSELVSSVV